MTKNTPRILIFFGIMMLGALIITACRSSTPAPTPDYDAMFSATMTAMAPVPTESIPFPPIDIPDPSPTGPVGTARVNVNVRTGPSMLFPILGTAQQGDKGELLGVSPDNYWYAVKVPVTVVGTGTAWVAADYVDVSNVTGALPVITPPLLPPLINFPVPPANVPQVTMLEAATLRSGPTLEFPVFGVAPAGARAEVLGRSEDDEWWAVRMPTEFAKDGTGWVLKLYTSAVNAGSVPEIKTPKLPNNITAAAPGSGAPSLVTREPLNVRVGPGNEYTSLGQIPKGSILGVVGVSPDGENYVINIPTAVDQSGQGWIPSRYVRAENVDKVPVVQPPPVR